MQELFAKRFVFIAKTILGLFILSVIFLMHKSETKNQEENIRTIKSLESVSGKLKIIYNTSDFDQHFRNWFQKNDEINYRKHIAFRTWLTAFISKHGVEGLVKDKRSGTIEFSLSSLESAYIEKTKEVNGVIGQKSDDSKISFNVARYKNSKIPINVWYAVSADSAKLAKKLDSIVKRAPEDYKSPFSVNISDRNLTAEERAQYEEDEKITLKVISVILQPKSIEISLNNDYYSQFVSRSIKIPVVTASKPIQLISVLTDSSGYNGNLDTIQLNKITQIYGDLDFTTAKDLMTKEFIKSYEEVSALGFDFPTRILPFAIIFFLFLVSVSIIFNLYSAKKEKVKLFTGGDTDDVLEPFTSNNFLRFILWIILPPLTVVFSIPIFQLSNFYVASLAIPTIIAVALNIYSWIISNKIKANSKIVGGI